MLGFGRSPESGINQEIIKLPQPSEYMGSYIERSEGKTDLGRAVELLQIRNAAEQGK